jgi:hypothetical protein
VTDLAELDLGICCKGSSTRSSRLIWESLNENTSQALEHRPTAVVQVNFTKISKSPPTHQQYPVSQWFNTFWYSVISRLCHIFFLWLRGAYYYLIESSSTTGPVLVSARSGRMLKTLANISYGTVRNDWP